MFRRKKEKDASKTQKVPLADQKVQDRQQKEKERQERKVPLDSKIKAEKAKVPDNNHALVQQSRPPDTKKDGESQLTVHFFLLLIFCIISICIYYF